MTSFLDGRFPATPVRRIRATRPLLAGLISAGLMLGTAGAGLAQVAGDAPKLEQQTETLADVTPFAQAIAVALARSDTGDSQIAAWYRANDFAPLWTGDDAASAARRSALLTGLEMVPVHGLPKDLFSVDDVLGRMAAARTVRERGTLDVYLSEIFVKLARDLQTGILTPSDVAPGMIRKVPLRDESQYLDGIKGPHPLSFIRSLPPQTRQYRGLLKAKLTLEDEIAEGASYGPKVNTAILKPGAVGRDVVALRDRLIAMGYMNQNFSATYDAQMIAAVKAFQSDMGLSVDGVAGKDTLGEINISMRQRLESIIADMERERWMNRPLGKRHIWVNLADFSAEIVDDGEVTFRTRAVVGQRSVKHQTPEFSDVMEYMMINPSWNVPRSIVVNEYLPQLQEDPNAAARLELIDSRGQVVPRDAIDFTQFTAQTFPFAMKEPPSDYNALGLVKFIFPNPNNIYLHDTPSKSLFNLETRAFSHGCVRLQKPFDFAYALLARQVSDPVTYFQTRLNSGKETQVNLKQPIQVHIGYRTAVVADDGHMEYRRDIYGRDAAIWKALAAQGVALESVQG